MLDAGTSLPAAHVDIEAAAPVHRPLLRLWLARLAPGARSRYLHFAQSASRPMFLAHAGCEGVSFLRIDESHEAVLTQWTDADAIVRLHLSERHRDTVQAMHAAGLIAAAAPVAIWPAPAALSGWVRCTAERIATAMRRLPGAVIV